MPYCSLLNVKGKAVSQHTYGGAGGRRCSSYSFTTLEQDGMSGQRHAPAALYPRGNIIKYSALK
jgi:hypothetical protein